MEPETLQALKDVLDRIHNNSAHALNHVLAVEQMLKQRPDLWKEYQKALSSIEGQTLHQDFLTLLGKIQ
jgi:hypothetical protein